MKSCDKAAETFLEGYNCAQAVFSSVAEQLGFDRDQALLLGSGFGGGIAKEGEVCGAVSGCILALGLKFGSTQVDPERKALLNAHIDHFLAEFRKVHGSIRCRELLGFDLKSEEGALKAQRLDIHHKVCPQFVMDAARLLEHELSLEL